LSRRMKFSSIKKRIFLIRLSTVNFRSYVRSLFVSQLVFAYSLSLIAVTIGDWGYYDTRLMAKKFCLPT